MNGSSDIVRFEIHSPAFKTKSSIFGGDDLGKQVIVAGTPAMDMSLKALQLHLLHYKYESHRNRCLCSNAQCLKESNCYRKLVETPDQEDDHSEPTNQHSVNYSDDARPARLMENITEGTPLLPRHH